ncbi:hypothetical protein FCV25MIE_20673 [Fagus crenata]
MFSHEQDNHCRCNLVFSSHNVWQLTPSPSWSTIINSYSPELEYHSSNSYSTVFLGCNSASTDQGFSQWVNAGFGGYWVKFRFWGY